MRVLVTGATGLIGSAVCDALLARGEEVVGLSRDPAKARSTNPTVSWHAWDPANERPPEAAFEGVDAVVNLIGEEINQRLTDEAKQRIRDSRVRATKNLVDGMLAANPQPGDPGQPGGDRLSTATAARRSSTSRPRRATASCLRSWSSGRTRRARAEGSGVRVVIFRTGLVLDPDGGLLKQLAAAVQARPRRAAGRRRPLHALDPPRRRGRADPLGARQPPGQRHPERDRAQSRSPTASSRRRSAARCTVRR